MPGASETASSARIVPLRREHVQAASDVIAAALAEADPAYAYIFPDPGRRRAAMRPFLSAPVRDALPFESSYAAVAGGEVLGAAIWLPPGDYPRDWKRTLRSMPALVSVLWNAPRSIPALMQLGAGIDDAFPDEPVWYLEVMGVKPEAQGRGLGSRLVEAALVRADREQVSCYLETAIPDNIGFYERFGFSVERELHLLSDGPPHWTMRRSVQRRKPALPPDQSLSPHCGRSR